MFPINRKKAVKKVFEDNIHHNDTTKKIDKACLSNQNYSVWLAVYHIFPKLNLRIIFPHVLLSETKVREVSEDSENTLF